MKTITTLSLLALLLVACSEDDNPTGPKTNIPAITFEQRIYAPNDTVFTSITNSLPDTAWFQLCGLLDVEILIDDSWEFDHSHAVTCRADLFDFAWVPPGDTLTYRHYYWTEGTYRFRARWLVNGRDWSESRMLYSAPFEVQ